MDEEQEERAKFQMAAQQRRRAYWFALLALGQREDMVNKPWWEPYS
jgi:hypothetical protein